MRRIGNQFDVVSYSPDDEEFQRPCALRDSLPHCPKVEMGMCTSCRSESRGQFLFTKGLKPVKSASVRQQFPMPSLEVELYGLKEAQLFENVYMPQELKQLLLAQL